MCGLKVFNTIYVLIDVLSFYLDKHNNHIFLVLKTMPNFSLKYILWVQAEVSNFDWAKIYSTMPKLFLKASHCQSNGGKKPIH